MAQTPQDSMQIDHAHFELVTCAPFVSITIYTLSSQGHRAAQLLGFNA